MTPTKKPLQTHVFTYRHDGEEWVPEIKATDAEDAHARLAKLGSATYDGVAVSALQTMLATAARQIGVLGSAVWH